MSSFIVSDENVDVEVESVLEPRVMKPTRRSQEVKSSVLVDTNFGDYKLENYSFVEISPPANDVPQVPPSKWARPPTIKMNGSLTERLRKQASKKRIGGVINSNGLQGKHGSTGVSGKDGDKGPTGEEGRDGGSGMIGEDGQDGLPGLNGENAINTSIRIEGIPQRLNVSGGWSGEVNIESKEDSESVLLVSCCGGAGGNGGNGGEGGIGGEGGEGGEGAPGQDGIGNQPGQPGGKGGNGGRGGNGGNGGKGGAGGNAGNGGSVLIQVVDPRLLALVVTDVSGGAGGIPGRGGKGGKGGLPGKGGVGGKGGIAGDLVPERQRQVSKSGPPGCNGEPGIDGKDGSPGTPVGLPGSAGSTLYMITDSQGAPLFHGSNKYCPVLEDYVIRNETEDYIFEPGQTIFVESVSIVNVGDFPVPDGVELTLVSPNGTVVVPNTLDVNESESSDYSPSYRLPEIPARSRLVVNPRLVAQIADVPQPTQPGPLKSRAHVTPKLQVFGRSFPGGYQAMEIAVKWPLRLKEMVSPTQCAPNEVIMLSVCVENISGLVYGCAVDQYPVAKDVHLYWKLDKHLIPVNEEVSSSLTSDKRIVMSLDSILSTEQQCFKLEVQISESVQPYETLEWSVGLVLRKRLIEIATETINVAAVYDSTVDPKDVLLITGVHTTRDEYLSWKTIFSGFGLGFDCWDLTYMNGISLDERTGQRHEAGSFIGRYHQKLIVFPLHNPKYIKLLHMSDIFKHFLGDFNTDFEITGSSKGWGGVTGIPLSESGLLLLGISHEQFVQLLFENSPIKHNYKDRFFDTHWFFNPQESDGLKKAQDLLNELDNICPLHMHRTTEVKLDFKKTKFGQRWDYGDLVISTMPLARTSHVLVLSDISEIQTGNVLGNSLIFQQTQVDLIVVKIPLESNFFHGVLGVISGLSLWKKVQLLLNDALPATNWQFVHQRDLDQSEVVHDHKSFYDVVYACIYDDLKTEYFVRDENLTRLVSLLGFIEGVPPELALKFAPTLFSLIIRLQNGTRWHAAPFSKSADIREKYVIAEIKAEHILLEKHGIPKTDVIRIKQIAREQANAPTRVKLRELATFSQKASSPDPSAQPQTATSTIHWPLRFFVAPDYF